MGAGPFSFRRNEIPEKSCRLIQTGSEAAVPDAAALRTFVGIGDRDANDSFAAVGIIRKLSYESFSRRQRGCARDGHRSSSGALTVNQAARDFPELARRLDHFTLSTRSRLSRSLVRALRGRRPDTRLPLNEAVDGACHELQVAGLDAEAIKAFLAALVEETGRACGADRPSLMSGEPRWMPVRSRVLDLADAALDLALVERREPRL